MATELFNIVRPCGLTFGRTLGDVRRRSAERSECSAAGARSAVGARVEVRGRHHFVRPCGLTFGRTLGDVRRVFVTKGLSIILRNRMAGEWSGNVRQTLGQTLGGVRRRR